MDHFKVTYVYWTRPRYKKGKKQRTQVTFFAGDLAEALRLAKDYGEQRFFRHRWQMIECRKC